VANHKPNTLIKQYTAPLIIIFQLNSILCITLTTIIIIRHNNWSIMWFTKVLV